MNSNIETRKGYKYCDKISSLKRYGFIHSHDNSRVLKVEGIGTHIDMFEAQQIVDEAQSEINTLRDALERIGQFSECSSSREIADWALEDFVQ